ncbi:hypothetical protein, partial [Winogradskyella luteola]
MTQANRLAIGSPAEGLMVYQTNSPEGFWFYDGVSWNQLTFWDTGEFQSIGGIVQNTTDISNDDFVFGSTTLSGSDSRFFFDKSKSAFRAGISFGNEWDDANVGDYSVVLGAGTASGNSSFSTVFGLASGNAAVAFQGSISSGNESFTAGSGTSSEGDSSIAMGTSNTIGTDGDSAVALGSGNGITA